MSQSTHDFILKIRHYFSNLWAAMTGSDPYYMERMVLNVRIEKAFQELQCLKEVHETALAQWKKDASNYQSLIETLRETIRDKEKQIAEQRIEFNRQINLVQSRREDD